jgi:hypothetical protein
MVMDGSGCNEPPPPPVTPLRHPHYYDFYAMFEGQPQSEIRHDARRIFHKKAANYEVDASIEPTQIFVCRCPPKSCFR